MIKITKGKKELVDYMSTLSMVAGNWMVGLVEILIGVVLNLKEKESGDEQLFMVLIVVGSIATVVLFVRSRMIYSRLKKQP